MFTKRHYEWLAALITQDPMDENERARFAYRLAARLKDEDSKFNFDKFIAACHLLPQ